MVFHELHEAIDIALQKCHSRFLCNTIVYVEQGRRLPEKYFGLARLRHIEIGERQPKVLL